MFKGFNFSQLFDIKNIFDLSPGDFSFYKEFIYLFTFFVTLSFALIIYNYFFVKNKITKKFLTKIRKFFFSFSVWSFLWLFLRWQDVYVFSALFVFYLILVVYFIKFILLMKYYLLSYKKELEDYNKKQVIKKYIPTKKNKNRKKQK